MYTLTHTTKPEYSIARNETPDLAGFSLPEEFIACTRIDDMVAITKDGARYARIDDGNPPALQVEDVPENGAFQVKGRNFEVAKVAGTDKITITSDVDYTDLAAFCFGTLVRGDKIDVGAVDISVVPDGAKPAAVDVKALLL